ncbi:MAG TPA: ATP-NAD kinase family protein [Methanolinea sp.]|nr:ATP-NAD kinase family protein [Methanolinea sp.]HQK56002.1 ATP-NAD kinase family protein [Methanolinea sp.]
MCTLGFLINPVAGMGGAVGLKGTDGMVEAALSRGAVPRAPGRAKETISLLKGLDIHFLTCSGVMGEDILSEEGISGYEVVYHPETVQTGAPDTMAACRAFLERKADLILFCGGDGTARDIYSVIGDSLPMLGIPAGVKMYSAVFAITPGAAAGILRDGCTPGGKFLFRDAEVMDVDEEAYREGSLRTRLFGIAKSPYRPGLVQGTKQVFEDHDEERAKKDIARFIKEVMEGTPDILYILGPGSTTAAIADEIGIRKTLLGFDAAKGGTLVATDLNEEGLLSLLGGGTRARLVISIIGAQGSVLGRGTQQVSPAVLRIIGRENIIVVATPHKLAETPLVFLDSGDRELDESFGDYISVVSGYRVAQRKRIGKTAGVGEFP